MTVIGLSNGLVLPQINTTVAAPWAYTQINVVKLSYVWTIINYSFLPNYYGRKLRSPIFSAEGDKNKWQLELYPNGYDYEYNDYVSLFLNLVSSGQPEVTAKIKLTILSADSEKNYSRSDWSHTYPNLLRAGSYEFLKLVDLQNLENGYLANDKLRILCEISATTDVLVTTGPKDTIEFNVTDRHLPNDLENLFEGEQFSDVSLVAGEKTFKAHKSILAGRSSVFSVLFEENSTQNLVELTAMKENVFREMLRFIYTDTVENLDELAGDLLVIADEYDLKKLKIMCEKTLFKSLSVDNAVELFIIADAGTSSKLKEKVLNFIDRHAKNVMETKSFVSITNSHPNLAAQILHRILKLDAIDREALDLLQ